MEISLIAAVGKTNEIGYENKLLWNIKEDMKWFIENTKNKPVIMGRTTYESIGKPLKDRINVVLSRNIDYNPHPDVTVLHSTEEVVQHLKHSKEVMVIGGENVYEQFVPYASKLYLTEIMDERTADAFFPTVNLAEDFLESYSRKGTEDTGFDYFFKIYKRLN